jgi:alpha-mannosidase
MPFTTLHAIEPDEEHTITFEPNRDGSVPGWLVAGPFEQPIVGLGGIGANDVIGETTVQPYQGKIEKGAQTENGTVSWITQHIDDKGFLDFNSTIRWLDPGKQVEKIWKASVGYASANIVSPVDQEVNLLIGSNSHLTVFINHQQVHSVQRVRNAVPDSDTVTISLSRGKNLILIKVGNTHYNESIQFFEPILWEWGFYARFTDRNGEPVRNLTVELPVTRADLSFEVVSTFFYKEIDNKLHQRLDLVVTSPYTEMMPGTFSLPDIGIEHNVSAIPFGESRIPIYIPAPERTVSVNAEFTVGGRTYSNKISLERTPRYELYLMLLSHTDIGYTHPQPVVKELHIHTLDDVLYMCDTYPDFKWTIETVWQLELFERSRTPDKFERLMDYIREGRISVSPVYTNPYTGWVGEEEMIRSFAKAKEYALRYGITYSGAIYNDVPGFAWMLPQLLENFGVKILVSGLNELFNNYVLQTTLPKAFHWKGAGQGGVTVYRTEAYNEGQAYGLEKGGLAIEQRMWERLKKLEAWGNPYDIVLLNSTVGDNGGIPKSQYYAAKEWNETYAYPKIKISTLDEFTSVFTGRYADGLPELAGDWMSTWDILYQGEPARMIRQRWTQHHLMSAEKIATAARFVNDNHIPLDNLIDDAYEALLHYSGHGSGLEYGYGSPADNDITMQFREEYIRKGFYLTEEVSQRALHRITRPEESFEGEAVILFNSLSWHRDGPVEVQFPKEYPVTYAVFDIETGEQLPSFQDRYKLYFVSRNIPPMGYKKYRLIRTETPPSGTSESLIQTTQSIENEFYRIGFNSTSAEIVSAFDKKNGREMIGINSEMPFNALLRERFQSNESIAQVPGCQSTVTVIDQRPVRLVLRFTRPDCLVKNTDYILWENLDIIDVEHEVDLEWFTETKMLEEYTVSFPFGLKDPRWYVEILGGFIRPEADRFPGITHDAYSIRRSVALSDGGYTIHWSAVDSRIIRLRESSSNGKRVLLANIVNNFPLAWNRQEENKGTWKFRFGFAGYSGDFKPALSARFGWECNTEIAIRRSWLRSENPQRSFLEIDNPNLIVLSWHLSKDRSAYIVRLYNPDGREKVSGGVHVPFEDVVVYREPVLSNNQNEIVPSGSVVYVELGPNEIINLIIKQKDHK